MAIDVLSSEAGNKKILDEVIAKLSRELNLPATRSGKRTELHGGIYIVKRQPHQLSYEDRVVTACFDDLSKPILTYFVLVDYMEGQLRLLKSTGTKIGRMLIQELSSVDLEVKRDKGLCDRIKKIAGKADLKLISIMRKVELPDFSEAYPFIKSHILYR